MIESCVSGTLARWRIINFNASSLRIQTRACIPGSEGAFEHVFRGTDFVRERRSDTISCHASLTVSIYIRNETRCIGWNLFMRSYRA